MFTKKSLSLYLILLIGFIDLMGIGLVYPMFASMLFRGDCLMLPADASDTFRGTCLGILLATMPITQFFSAPLLGLLSDQKGRKTILVPSLLIGVIGYLIAVFAVSMENLILLLISRVAVGISAGSAAVVGATLADVSAPEEKTKNFGLLNMACGLGFTAGPFLGGVLSGYDLGIIGGYSLPFAVAGVVTFLNFIMSMLFFEETRPMGSAAEVNLMMGIRNIKKAFSMPGLQVIFFTAFLACVGWSFYWEFTPVTWIEQFGFSTGIIGNLYAFGAAVYALSCGLLIRPIVNRYSNHHILFAALIGCSLSIGMLLFHTEEKWLILYIPLQQFCMALFWPTTATVVSNAVEDNVQGEMLGVLQSMESLAFAVSPLIAGPLLGISAAMPIIIGMSTILLAAIILGSFLKEVINAALINDKN